MQRNTDLLELEKRAFRSMFQDGMWDIFLGLLFCQFAIAPLLNDLGLGDLGSSVVFLPPLLGAAFLLKYGKKHITAPRLGFVQFAERRKSGIKKIVLFFNISLVLGAVAGLLVFHMRGIGWLYPAVFCAIVAIGSSAAAYYMNYLRFLAYGFLVVVSIITGELLYIHAGVAHHGYPIVFGVTSAIMIICGIYSLVRFLRKYPLFRAEQSNG